MTEADRTRTSIVAHPPYLNYLDRHGPVTFNPARDKLNVLFLGQLRADKSPSDLVQVLQELREAQARLIACGKGSLGDLGLRLEQAHVEVDDRTSAMGVTDEAIIQAISASHVLCAPYKEATQSGSIIMAITAGLPVVAYDSGALSDLREWITLVPVGDAQAMGRELAKRRDRQDNDPQEHIQRVEKWSRDAVASWVEAVQA
jgi:glycosyltransferase involved in cell wall biosynthesis